MDAVLQEQNNSLICVGRVKKSLLFDNDGGGFNKKMIMVIVAFAAITGMAITAVCLPQDR